MNQRLPEKAVEGRLRRRYRLSDTQLRAQSPGLLAPTTQVAPQTSSSGSMTLGNGRSKLRQIKAVAS